MAVDTSHVDYFGLMASDLKKKGANEYTGACPICKQGTDRFNVQPDNKRWLCRVCTSGKWRDAVDFLVMRDGLSFVDACKQLDVPLESYKPDSNRSKPKLSAVPEMDSIPLWRRQLMARGVLPMSIDRYRITDAGLYWQYPSYGTQGGVIYRNKRKEYNPDATPKQIKYWTDWTGRDAKPKVNRPADCIWYSAGGLLDAIKAHDGVCWLSSGEPNVWVLHSALCDSNPQDAVNATFWMDGEGNMPKTIIEDLQAFGVTKVLYAPDCDTQGIQSAYALRDALKDSPIELVTYQLPGAKDSKYDIGDLWLDCDGKPYAFQEALASLPLFKFEADKPDEKPISVSSTDAMLNLLDRLDGTSVVGGEPLVIPMADFHALGGFAKVIMPGKLIGVVAPSGHGKTSFLETWAGHWNEQGHSGLWFGTEWTPDEYTDRAIQRFGGASYEDMMLHELWKKEVQLGTPQHLCFGKELSVENTQKTQKAMSRISRWKGKMHYFPDALLSLEQLLEQMSIQLRILRSAGERVNFAVFDYVNLLRVATPMEGTNRAEYATELVKQWAITNDIVGILGIQVTKDESRSNKGGKRLISEEGALYVRSDKYNLFITLNIIYIADPSDPERTIRTNRAVANVAKNSAGQTGEIDMITGFEYLTWYTASEFSAMRRRLEKRHEAVTHYSSDI